MSGQRNIFNTIFVIVAALLCVLVAVQASPVPEVPVDTAAEAQAPGAMREGRFYGLGGAQASSFAAANAGASGLGLGYPYGGGVGLASSQATASANAGAMGYPYGK